MKKFLVVLLILLGANQAVSASSALTCRQMCEISDINPCCCPGDSDLACQKQQAKQQANIGRNCFDGICLPSI